MNRLKVLFICLALGLAGTTHADTYVVSFADIRDAVDNSDVPPDEAISALLAQTLRDELDALGFDFSEGGVLGEFDVDELTEIIDTSCPIPSPYEVHTDATTATVTIDEGSSIAVGLDSLQSITLNANLTGVVTSTANAWVRWGQDIPFGSDCEKFDTDNGWISVTVPFDLDLSVDLQLDPTYDAVQVAIVVDKQATVAGDFVISNAFIDYDFGVVSLTEVVLRIFEDRLTADLEAKGVEAFDNLLVELVNRLDGLDADGNPDPTIEAFNGPTTFALDMSEEDTAFVRDVLELLGLPDIVISMLGTRGIDILLDLVVLSSEERDAYLAALGAEVGCEALFTTYRTVLDRNPLYHDNGGSCVAAPVTGTPAGPYFTEAGCTNEVAFTPADEALFCQALFSETSETILGNAAAWQAVTDQPNDVLPSIESLPWTTVPSTELDLGTVSVVDNKLPYMKQLRYKVVEDVERGTGICELEMRVYKSDVTATGLKPLLALHGGTWKSRGTSFLGLEAGVSQFTERGFIVFAPFYRLVASSDGNVECNGAGWREVAADVESALDWVQANGGALGASGGKVTVFGQSAGGHLAGWLAAHRPAEVRKALLFYAPVDILGFLSDAQQADSGLEDFREFAMRSIATLFGARQGVAEVRLDTINFDGVTPAALADNWDTLIPGSAFALSGISLTDVPVYLDRCAALTGVDLAAINLAVPPDQLTTCLKEELRDFLIDNSFNDKLADEEVPVFAVHGSGDTLVPHRQAVDLCSAIDGTVFSSDIVDVETLYSCGTFSEVRVIRDAEHMLDLGFCIEPICPAGEVASQERAATIRAIRAGFDWAVQNPVVVTPPPIANPPPSSGGGGAVSLIALLGLIYVLFGMAIRRRLMAKLRP
ncbi:MAG: alpha/beta hydrolase [Gammaproteobacteria bacterium]|nr:alpha/beta hydrolase [Gammaproteobacteria bacterium]